MTTMYIFRGPVIVFILALFSLLSTTSQHYPTCSEAFSKMKEDGHFEHCMKLPTLGAEFAWNIQEDHARQVNRIDVFFGTRQHAEIGWLAWGVNPTNEPEMVGTRAIIGIRMPNDTLAIDTYNVTAASKLGCGLQPSKIDFFKNMKINYSDTNHYFTISMTLYLPQSDYNISSLNHVWQVGYQSIGMEPQIHPTSLQNVDSAETINLKTRVSEGVGQHRHHLRKMLALRLKPKRTDKYRKFWNSYHHCLGYALLAAISVDIFLGIGILKPLDHAWKWSYFGVLGILGVIFLLFEIYSWCKFLNQKEKNNQKSEVSEQQRQNK
ncbi:hypothetical protein EZV62_008800 [Acer yangbiense]|uniref:DOMON domain-containing protein n=1 Tax=Acer yangbiense TaxID=1000413 RepID=A0A5C7IEU9_9ROSI|nr:hypothetical protein EZV62_008800 [Acer yangbiense]